jgi:hypothetical protein
MNKQPNKYLIFRKNTKLSLNILESTIKDKKLNLSNDHANSDLLNNNNLIKRSLSNIISDVNYIDKINVNDSRIINNKHNRVLDYSFSKVEKDTLNASGKKEETNQNMIKTDGIVRDNNINRGNHSFSFSDNNKNEEVKLEISLNCRMMEYYSVECYICEINKSENLIVKLDCGHSICLVCFKLFYEEAIETKVKVLKCPNFQCKTLINEELVPNIVSMEHWNIHLQNQQTDMKKINNYFPIEFNKEKSYKHIIKYGRDFDQFKEFRKLSKERYCRFCQYDSLFGKFNKDFYKCLNCNIKFCKLCLKEFTESHFYRNSVEYCKVYYNKFVNQPKYSQDVSFFQNYNIIFIILFFVYWIFLFFGLISFESNLLVKALDPFNKESNIFLRGLKLMIYSIGLILITLINIFLLILIFPIYPALATVLIYF